MGFFNIYIKLDSYLAQWFVNEQGGDIPVKLIRGSVESAILEQFLQRQPDDLPIDTSASGKLPIIIPCFKHKPPEKFFYLPPKAEDLLVSSIRNRFDICLWQTLHRFENMLGRQDELIFAFMEKHGIEVNDTNWNAIAKRYQRMRNKYLNSQRQRKFKKKLGISVQ